jgi:hypothetical protein
MNTFSCVSSISFLGVCGGCCGGPVCVLVCLHVCENVCVCVHNLHIKRALCFSVLMVITLSTIGAHHLDHNKTKKERGGGGGDEGSVL